jgi:hypothetical protein
MGRYYSGDIEGKFWFAVQSSTAADRFGVEHSEPNYVNYYFEEEDLEGVEQEIADIEESLGDKKQKLDDFFASVNGYTDKDIEALGVTKEELSDYADLGLGIKIRDCIKENGACSFDAEL